MSRALRFFLILFVLMALAYVTYVKVRETTWQADYDAGRTALAEGRLTEARAQYQAAVEAARGFGERDSKLAQSLIGLGFVSIVEGKDDDARRHFQEAMTLLEKLPGGEAPDIAECLNGLAIAAGHQAKNAEARAFLERALAIRQKSLGLDHPIVAETLDHLAWVHCNEGHYAEAERARSSGAGDPKERRSRQPRAAPLPEPSGLVPDPAGQV